MNTKIYKKRLQFYNGIVMSRDMNTKLAEAKKSFEQIIAQTSKSVVGQTSVIRSLLRAVIANGHVLLEGVPGTAKTLIVKTLAKVTECGFSRIQFTPDLLPTDIVGITAFDQEKGFYIIKGPIFNNFILADEINRAPPKVQSALLEAMAERQATIGKQSFNVPKPFFVLATQNPVEQTGTYPLPEAQVDRFLFKLFIDYPSIEEEQLVLTRNATVNSFESYKINSVLSESDIIRLQEDVKDIYMDEKVEKYIVKIIDATRRPQNYSIESGKYIEWGASPRGSIGLFIASKAEAMMEGSSYVTPQHVKNITPDVLRHRIIVNYEGQAENIKPDDIISEILSKIPVP